MRFSGMRRSIVVKFRIWLSSMDETVPFPVPRPMAVIGQSGLASGGRQRWGRRSFIETAMGRRELLMFLIGYTLTMTLLFRSFVMVPTFRVTRFRFRRRLIPGKILAFLLASIAGTF